MTDRVYPSAKPNPQPPPPAANGGPPSFPATKSQMYGANRPIYRPQPSSKLPRRRSRRGYCCSCCLWFTLVLLGLILLAAIAGGIFYIIYRPHRPTFSVSSLRLSALNVTASNLITSRIDLSLTTRNPNRKIEFLYDSIFISASSGSADVGEGSLPAFVHGTKNTTILKTTLTRSGQSSDSSLASDLKKKNSIPLEVDLETRAGVKIGSLKTKKIGIRVFCSGITVAVPKGKGGAAAAAVSPDASCKVKIRVKIWKWTV